MKIKLPILALSIFCLATFVHAQSVALDPANGWIVPGQTYIRIVTEEEGIYRVAVADLQPAGFNSAAVDPDLLHLLYRGVEVPIHVIQSANQLVAFEFYSSIHDGADEAFLYRDNMGEIDLTAHPNPRMSQISKESAFFLTWNNQAGLRYAKFADFNYGGMTPEACYRTHVAQNYADTLVQDNSGMLWVPYSQNPQYVSGEGYAGPYFSGSAAANFMLDTPHGCPSPDSSTFTIRTFGNSSDFSQVDVMVNGNHVVSDQLTRFYTKEWAQNFAGPVPTQSSIMATEGLASGNFVSYAAIDYDRSFSLDADAEQHFTGKPSASNLYCHWQNGLAIDSCWIFDLTNGLRISGTATSATSGFDLDVVLPANAAQRELYLVTDAGFRSPTRIEQARLEDYSHQSGVDFLIITDRSLQASASAYAAYRSASPTNGMSAAVFYTDALYDEFGYGAPTPLAIKRFLMTADQTWPNAPRFVLLWGKAQNDARNAIGNLVPTWGYPAFDIEFGCNFDQTPVSYLPQLPIGRIPVQNDAQGQDYLDKVQRYESYSFEPWMLNAAFFSYDIPANGSVSYSQVARDSALFAAAVSQGNALLYHSDSTGVHSTSPLTSAQAIDQGVAWIDFKEFGIDNSVSYDCDLKAPSLYNNVDRFPFITGIGSQPGDCLADTLLLAERWVLEPHKGAIGFLGAADIGFSGPWFAFMQRFLGAAYANTSGKPIGEMLDSAFINSLGSYPSLAPSKLDFVLFADPSLVIVNPFTTHVQEGNGTTFEASIFPNPFSDVVHFDFELTKATDVRLEVIDVAGRIIHSSASQKLFPGTHRMDWEPAIGLAAGIYIAKLQIGDMRITKKLVHGE